MINRIPRNFVLHSTCSECSYFDGSSSNRESNLDPMEWIFGVCYLIARDTASEKRKLERHPPPPVCKRKTSRARMHRDLQRGRNSGWRVYNGETSRIIKRNAADVLGVTRLDGGKLDLRGWNWLTRACAAVSFPNGARMFRKIVPRRILIKGEKVRRFSELRGP